MKIALVTGANRGIGFCIAKGLAKKGMRVVLTSRDEKNGKDACENLQKTGLDVVFCRLDVTYEASVREAARFVKKSFGKLDILVNNAGILIDGKKSTLDVDMETFRKTLETNLYGPLVVSQKFIPLLAKSGDARIINISSGAGSLCDPSRSFSSYSISKTALNGLTVKMANDLRGKVRVNCMCPGWVRTGMGGSSAERSADEGADTAVWLATAKNVPTGRFFRDRKQINW